MWRSFVGKDNTAGAFGLPFGLALHQHRNTPFQNVDLTGLARDHVEGLVDRHAGAGEATLLVDARGFIPRVRRVPLL